MLSLKSQLLSNGWELVGLGLDRRPIVDEDVVSRCSRIVTCGFGHDVVLVSYRLLAASRKATSHAAAIVAVLPRFSSTSAPVELSSFADEM